MKNFLISYLNYFKIKSNDKKFLIWIFKKDKLHAYQKIPHFKEGEIWWAALGENIGVEINGKSDRFSRPVLVLKKLGTLSLMAIPLTSQFHHGSWYFSFKFRNTTEYAALAQARVLSAKRLYNNMGHISKYELEKIRKAFCVLYRK